MGDPIFWRASVQPRGGQTVVIVQHDGLSHVICFDTPEAEEGRLIRTEVFFKDAVAYCQAVFGIPPDAWR